MAEQEEASTTQLVGIVVVSHSPALARAAVDLASEMLHERPVRMAIAAGLPDATLGTDAVRIQDAIEEVDSPEGVVVLMDLGSAVLSAELALDLIEDPEVRERVILSPAPLVEGLVVAAVAAAGGADRKEVAAEAQSALMGKTDHLSPSGGSTETSQPTADSAQEVATFVVHNRHGLHARPAARLVSEMRALDATVQLRNLTTGAGPIPAASLSRVATLGALEGHNIEILAAGPQAQEAIEHLLAMAERRFDEPADQAGDDVAEPIQVVQRGDQGNGPLAASSGIGIGSVRRLSSAPVPTDEAPIGAPAEEWQRVIEALTDVRRDIDRVRAVAARDVGEHEARIFDAHLMLLSDIELLDDVKRRIGDGDGAVSAWIGALEVIENQWAELDDPYLRGRAEDVRAVGAQMLTSLTGTPAVAMTGVGILVAAELSPAQAAELDRDCAQGIVLAFGSPSSHAVILARSRGIPAVVAAGPDVLDLAEGTSIVIDGGSGELVIEPSEETLAQFRERAAELGRREQQDRARADESAVSVDGAVITVAANLGSGADATAAAAAGADGAGLVRTEFMFLGRDRAPDVDEQTREYLAIAETFGDRQVTFRTLDVGGDKPLSYLSMPVEANPFLGHRGIRLSLDRGDLLRDQLAALCRVARRAPISVMFPMVSKLAELQEAREVLSAAAGPEGIPDGLRVGMMVEVPAAALKIGTFLPHLDFISVGTNDLTQYTLAAERGNPAVAGLADPLDPGVLRLIQQVCNAAHGQIPVAVCGEAAADPTAIPILLGLGVGELSVSGLSVPSVKARVRALDLTQCATLAKDALELGDAAEVRHLVSSALADAPLTS